MESSRDTATPGERYCFEGFSLYPEQRLLLRGETPVRVGARALEILIALAARPGELVTKDELTALVWPGIFVDATNLRVNLAALRKALGDSDGRLISTDPGRGYRLNAVIARNAPPPASASATTVGSRRPVPLTRLIGRDGFVAGVAEQLSRRRLITIVGPGGIGKTRVAMASAETLAASYRDGVAFIDLTVTAENSSAGVALAQALDIAIGADDTLRDVLEYLRDREMLLVFDNCEHVIEAAAALIETVAVHAPGVHILATSREALRVQGEWVRSLPPLSSPPDTGDLSAAEALRYPAVELFVERAGSVQEAFCLGDAEAPIVGRICRRLDGVALAIELVAAQVDAFDLTWLEANLHQRLWILGRGRRTAVPRHQTLSALFDWSYRLLSEQERQMLARVAIFPDDFTLAEAIDVASDGAMDADMLEAVGGLVAKSLATADISGPVTRFRVPEMTRAFACARSQHAAVTAMV